jgi:beta-glucosidase-like glycosyl hydrolase
MNAYRDPLLPVEERVQDLLGRMTLEEKAAQTAAPFGSAVDVHTPPAEGWGNVTAGLSTLGLPPREAAQAGNELQRRHVEGTRLGIPVLFAEEALVGLKVRDATVFPDAIAQAATWDPELVEEMTGTIGRQMARLGVRQALSPLADVAVDPRWGRVEETYGEEPYLVGSMATAFVRGLQQADPRRPVVATLKHFLGYGASDGGRNTDAANIGPRALREVHGVPFEMAIRVGGASGVMPAYNTIDGEPLTGSRRYLTGLLREQLGFEGLVISDLEAVSQLETKHAVVGSTPEAMAAAIGAGIDLDLANQVRTDAVLEAVRSGLLDERDLDRSVANVLRTKFRLGLFEQPYVDVGAVPETFDSPEERALARRVAERSIVLLQNQEVGGRRLLPLQPDVGTVAVIGPNAHRPMGQLGNYSYQVLDSMTRRFALAADPQARAEDAAELGGRVGADNAQLLVESVPVVTFLEGIRNRLGPATTVLHEPGCLVAAEDRSGFPAAVHAAAAADIAVVVVGDQSGINAFGTVGEGLDSADCELPGVQRELVEAVVATGTPTVVVLSHGRPYVLGWMADLVPAILTGFFGGEEAGNAMAAVLFGDVNPAGRLPIALLHSVGAAPVPYWRTLHGSDYVAGSVRSVFPFGHGLSYTTFEHRDLEVSSADVPTDGTIRLAFTVANVGDRAGDEVVQVYAQDVVGRTARPARALVAFRRLHLEARRGARVSVDVPASMLALWDAEEGWVVEPGRVKLFVGASSAAIRLKGEVTLTGPVQPLGPGRELRGRVEVTHDDLRYAPTPRIDPVAIVVGDDVPPLTETSTIAEWLDHPLGGAVLRVAMGGPSFEEDQLRPIGDLPLAQLVTLSGGQFSRETFKGLLASVQQRST